MKGYGSWGAGWAGGEESTEEINMKHMKLHKGQEEGKLTNDSETAILLSEG